MTNMEDKMVGDFAKPKMLFLDDRTKRIMSALEQYKNKYDVTIVTNAKECLRYLCRQEWDILSLDHDLNGDDFQDPDDTDSGMEVVRYITRTGWAVGYKIPEIWIHSSNLFAANLMIDVLFDVGIEAYYRKFEYDANNIKTPEKHEPVKDTWASDGYRSKCSSCGNEAVLDRYLQCHECYKRELVQCQG